MQTYRSLNKLTSWTHSEGGISLLNSSQFLPSFAQLARSFSSNASQDVGNRCVKYSPNSFSAISRYLEQEIHSETRAVSLGLLSASLLLLPPFALTALAAEGQDSQLPPRTSPSLTLQPAPPDLVSNEHTAKWRIFTDRGRDITAQGNLPEAELCMRRALQEARQGFGPKDPHVAAALQNLAELMRLMNRLQEAEPLYLEALSLLEAAYGQLHPAVGTALHNVAGLYVNKGDLAAAESYYTKALKIRNDLLGKRHPESSTTAYHLAEILRMRGRPTLALPLYADSLAYFGEIGALSSPVAIRRLGRFLEALVEAKRWREYEGRVGSLVDLVEDVRGAGHDTAAQVAEQLASFLRSRGRAREAEGLLEAVLRARRDKYGDGHPLLARSLTLAAESQLAAPRPDPQALAQALLRLHQAAQGLRGSIASAAARRSAPESPRALYGSSVELTRLSLDLNRALRLTAKAEELRAASSPHHRAHSGGAASGGASLGLSTSPEAEAALLEALRVGRRARAEFDLSDIPAEIFGMKAKKEDGQGEEGPAGMEVKSPSLLEAALRVLGFGDRNSEWDQLRELKAPTLPTRREVQTGLSISRAFLLEHQALVDDLLARLSSAKNGNTASATELRRELEREKGEISAEVKKVEENVSKAASPTGL